MSSLKKTLYVNFRNASPSYRKKKGGGILHEGFGEKRQKDANQDPRSRLRKPNDMIHLGGGRSPMIPTP